MFAINRLVFRLGFDLRVLGRENLPARGPFVFAPNHIGYLDGRVQDFQPGIGVLGR